MGSAVAREGFASYDGMTQRATDGPCRWASAGTLGVGWA
jgi:hypothetical protein